MIWGDLLHSNRHLAQAEKGGQERMKEREGEADLAGKGGNHIQFLRILRCWEAVRMMEESWQMLTDKCKEIKNPKMRK